MKKAAPADLQRWSEEVARDPASLAFVPLARAYRRQDRADAALRLCLRGLDHHPDNTEAHGLLALLYLDRGEHQRAADEWSIVLRLDPANFDALRGLGFCLLENGAVDAARTHLERAALIRPDDSAVRDALRLASGQHDAPSHRAASNGGAGEAVRASATDDAHTASGAAPPRSAGGDAFADEPWMQTPDPATYGGAAQADGGADMYPPEVHAGAPVEDAVRTPDPWEDAHVDAPAASAPAPVDEPWAEAPADPWVEPVRKAPTAVPARAAHPDPRGLFDGIVAGPVLGAVLLDARGYVLAGTLDQAGNGLDALAAVLGSATGEAARTAAMLGLGAWHGMLLETGNALLHVARVDAETIVMLVARSDMPAGWMLRSAAQAVTLAQQFLQEYA